MKKLLSLGISAALMVSMAVVPASAVAATDEALALATLQSMNVVEDSNPDLDAGLTRAQFADMLVKVTDNTDLLATTATRNLFSDVSTTHWASSEINLVYQLGYMNGNGDGTFAPDRTITLGEAVTAVLRVLGYTSADIGYAWPNDYIAAAQTMGLLDDIDTSASTFTYGDGVSLLAAMLMEETADGDDYADSLGASSIDDVLILGNDEDNGVLGDLLYVYTDSGFAYYEQVIEMPDDLVESCRGTLILNKSGSVCGFIPNDETRRTISISDVDASGVYNENDALTMVASSATMIIDDTQSTFGASYYELENYDQVILCYGNLGTVELVIPQTSTSTAGYIITGYFEDAYPNPSQPETVQVLGTDFDVDDDAAGQFASIAYGDKICMTLDESGDVVSVCSYSYSASDDMVGILNGDTVTLTCGITITGDISTSVANGRMVRVVPTDVGEISAYAVTGSSTANFDVANEKVGTYNLAADVQIYEYVGTSVTEKITYSSINVDYIARTSVSYYHVDSNNEVDIILLNDVTGNLYTYGIIVSGTVYSGVTNDDNSKVYNNTAAIENGDGTTSYITSGIFKTYEDEPAGIVYTADGDLADYVILENAGTTTRTAFSGEDDVVLDGIRYEIASDVQVYNDMTGFWTTLTSAKASCSSFECYYDRDPDEGGQIRVILAYE